VKVMGRWSVRTVDVRADGTGLCSRAGTSLLALAADRLGLTGGLSAALAGTRERLGGHDPGRVFCDLAVMLADGGRCVSDLAALAGQESLFGEVASVSTARRVVRSIGSPELTAVRAARARARARAWAAGAAPERVILDFDATPIVVHSEKDQAAGHYKGGFGFNPLIAACGREILAGILRPGNAGANNAEDHLALLDLALEQLPAQALDGEILARSDSAGASHDLADACRECDIRFSFGYPLTEPVRQALLRRTPARSCPSQTSTVTASSASSPTRPTPTSPSWKRCTANTPSSRTASRRSRRPAPATCPSTASMPTPRGSSSPSARTT